MSWNEFVIGKGEKRCSAVRVFDILGDHSISQNDISYWVSNCILGISGKIYKDTIPGKKITAMIKAKVPIEGIQKYIDQQALKYTKIDCIYNSIERLRNDAYRLGKDMKSAEIRDALGI